MKRPTPRCLIAAVLLCFDGSVSAQQRLLTTALEVRSLSVAEAEKGIPVQLRGVVVFIEGPSAVFLQDDTSTTFFQIEKLPPLAVGDEIEMRGMTRMGLYLPGLTRAEITVVGQRMLPPGIPARYDDLVSGRFHYQRVAVEGIVRSITAIEPKKTLIRLATGSRVIEARVERPPDSERDLVDHRVRVTGLAFGFINERRQLVQPYVRVLDWTEVNVLAPAPPAGEVPFISAEELLAFRVTGHGEQRIRIEGVVTAVFGRDQIYLRQADKAFGARLTVAHALKSGDRVAIAGFPEMDRFSASVADAELMSRESGAPPEPVTLDAPEKLTGAHDGNLVSVEGTVRDAFKSDGGTVLLLGGKAQSIQARLPDGSVAPETGARVRITGICQVESAAIASDFVSRAGVVSLRARMPADVTILKAPSWWTPRRLGIALGIFTGIITLAALWILVLRTQVRRQTAALRHRIESEAALEERQRIAREFHDTLEQELAGVSLRLDALATRDLDEKGRSLIAASRNLVSRIQAETRDLISDLRDPAEIAGDLLAALTDVAARHSAESGVAVRVEAATLVPTLPAKTIHDLRMIARESVTNAIKHAAATRITIALAVRDDVLALRIEDDGGGFDLAATTRGKPGHFGCAGMRERCRKLGAEIAWRSAAGKGTTVEVAISIRNRERERVNNPGRVQCPTPPSLS